jgi:hypothetical protein
LVPAATPGQVQRRAGSPLAERVYRHPDLQIPNRVERADRLPQKLAAELRDELAELGVAPEGAFLDLRGGRWGTLLPARPLLPGSGIGNRLGWRELGIPTPAGRPDLERAAWNALLGYLTTHATRLRLHPAELAPGRVTVHDGGDRLQIYAPRAVAGVPVRGSFVNAVVNHGNLVLLGARHWGDVEVATTPTVPAAVAVAVFEAHVAPHWPQAHRRRPELVILPLAAGATDPRDMALGAGYRHRLAWVLTPDFQGDLGRWEALIDAHTGELLAFDDTNRYASTRTAVGGVYPVSNDGAAPDGTEQPGTPMPFADLVHGGGTLTTDAGGNAPICVEGMIETALVGPFLAMTDACGTIAEASGGDLDLGAGPGIDCDVPEPGVSSPGNTHASRTAFHELGRAQEAARALLPGNTWLRAQLGALVNLPDFGIPEFNCIAFWDETTVNFFDSGEAAPGIVCSNTGEISGVLDHEWGHGLDDNDALPTISNPGEGIADVYAALRLNESCIARGFFLSGSTCGGDDPCTACDGVRDVDFARHQSGLPHDLAWIDAHCEAPIFGDAGPCGGGVHCEGFVVGEAIWDLVHRDLASPPFDMDLSTALALATRLTYLGAGAVGDWFQCVDGSGLGDGCNADGGYLNFLAIDDDNGNLADGTPRMGAIHAAFDRHGIACDSPPVVNAGCSGAPASPPVVVATPLDRGAALAWEPVAGASAYEVFRAEGVHGCNFGKVKVGETTGSGFVDGSLLNDRQVFYVVVPVGADPTCTGPASSCVAVTPQPAANLTVDTASVELALTTGDGDPALDNCESAELSFDVVNIGSGALTNVTLVGVDPLSHPEIAITTSFPVVLTPSLPECASVAGSFAFTAAGLSFNDVVEFRVEVTADELGGVRSQVLRLAGSESDLESHATKTFGFESDLEGWQVVAGTFDRAQAGGGAGGSAFYLASSSDLPDQCDGIRSPLLQLSPTSTLSLSTNFDIEPPFIIEDLVFWYDRANVGIRALTNGQRTPVSPDGGRLYNASGSAGSCETTNQDGWADAMPTWAESTWSATALGAAGFAGELVELELRYGTDVAVEGSGFRFDEVNLTDFGLVVPDGQPDICLPPDIFADGFESGDTSAWSTTVP